MVEDFLKKGYVDTLFVCPIPERLSEGVRADFSFYPDFTRRIVEYPPRLNAGDVGVSLSAGEQVSCGSDSYKVFRNSLLCGFVECDGAFLAGFGFGECKAGLPLYIGRGEGQQVGHSKPHVDAEYKKQPVAHRTFSEVRLHSFKFLFGLDGGYFYHGKPPV